MHDQHRSRRGLGDEGERAVGKHGDDHRDDHGAFCVQIFPCPLYVSLEKNCLRFTCVTKTRSELALAATPAPRVTAAAVGKSVGRPAIRIQSLDTRERALAEKATEGEAESGRILERETGFEPATLSLEG